MRVRLRAVRLHDRADQHFERRRADGLGADHAHVGGAGVVGRRVGGKVGRPDHGGDGLHSGWIPAVLTAAAHFAISDFTNARSSSGVDPRLRPPVLENSWRTAGIGERGAQQLVQLRDGVLRRLRGNEGRRPHRHLEALQAGFLQGGHIAQQQLAIGARGGQRAQLAAHHERQRRADVAEHEVDLPAHQVGQRRRRALVRHRQQIGAGGGLEQFAGDAAGGVAGAEVQPLAAGAQLREKRADVLVRAVRRHEQQQSGAADHADRLEVLHRVVGQLLEHRRVGGVRGVGRQEHRVPVRRGSGRRLCRDEPRGAGAVVDDDGLPRLGGQPLAEHARPRVRAAAGRKGNDDLERLGRVWRRGRHRRQREQGGCQEEENVAHAHRSHLNV